MSHDVVRDIFPEEVIAFTQKQLGPKPEPAVTFEPFIMLPRKQRFFKRLCVTGIYAAQLLGHCHIRRVQQELRVTPAR